MHDFNFADYEGDELDMNFANNPRLGWCLYINTAESLDKAKEVEVGKSKAKVTCPQEVGIAVPLADVVRLRDYLTAAIADIELRTAKTST